MPVTLLARPDLDPGGSDRPRATLWTAAVPRLPDVTRVRQCPRTRAYSSPTSLTRQGLGQVSLSRGRHSALGRILTPTRTAVCRPASFRIPPLAPYQVQSLLAC
ncbi:hypothetical protein FOPG_18214 [Fusarium oxysporum f. sp. conglutinans race 2 54008]|uniref:Uncharacterized protein n=1 Tax=Fusarium oxysporum f. sp. conglutinans race 2 54008 TaxID=1089457 RepID=X0GPK7_FUSOX|nr:hypothetical protein FOPG_18214 [Fusarium oxysporum f. sp. conglutinans race 2 54008]